MNYLAFNLINLSLALASCCIFLASGAILIARETLAQSVQTLPVSAPVANSASPISVSPVVDIELAYGYGVTISFIPVGETVQKIWLDDPSFLTVDVDGCLKGLNEDCDKQVATLIHLRRINQIDIPHIPHTGRTMMTVVTRGENGEQKIYLFHIKKTDKVSDLMLVINIFPFDLNTQELEP
ncbi:MAG TPA: hypothetical protein DD379_13155 [Cyanobacteria bacterium UBA11162]|nr:hypothetical protein [Cyanobacteria bacterium UBA11162]